MGERGFYIKRRHSPPADAKKPKAERRTATHKTTNKNALNRLKSTHEITVTTTNRYSLRTIDNWANYQVFDRSGDTQNDDQNDNQTTHHGQKNDTRNDNNIRNKRKNKELKELYNVENNKENFEQKNSSYDIEEFERRANELPVYRPRSGPAS